MTKNMFSKGSILAVIFGLLAVPVLVLGQSALTANITAPANNAEVTVGQSVSFAGTATGGEAPYSYLWIFSDNTQIAGQNVNKTFNETGNVTVSFRATDKNLNTNVKNISIKVVDAPTSDALAVSNIQVSNVTTNSAVITWTTNKPATSRVIYDTTSRPSIASASAPNYGYANSTQTFNGTNWVTTHSVTVTGLSPNTKYFFRVISTRN